MAGVKEKLSSKEKIERVLSTWENMTKYLNTLMAEEVMVAIKAEAHREGGPRDTHLTRMLQRYDNMTKNARIQRLRASL